MLDFEQVRGTEHQVYPAGGGLSLGHSGGTATAPGFKPGRGAPPAGDGGSLLAHCLVQSLDHVGRGMLLVGPAGQLLHANRLAQSALAGSGHALLAEGGRVTARNARDQKLLAEAIDAALLKGVRRMLTLGRSAAEAGVPAGSEAAAGSAGGTLTVAILPIETHSGSAQEAGFALATGGHTGRPQRAHAVLISLPQCSHNKNLAVPIFAREHGCTSAEAEVLEALLAGQTPEAIAQQRQVKLCTVRTQIGQLRLKTGSHTIRELLDRVAALPPMMVVVQ